MSPKEHRLAGLRGWGCACMTDRQTDDWDGTEATTFQRALGTSSAESKIPTSSYPRTGMVWPRKDKDKNCFMGVTPVSKAPSK